MRWITTLALAAAMAGSAIAQGPDGSALRFDGVDDWVDFGTGPTASAPFTLEAWVKPTQASTQPQLIAGPFGAERGGCFQGAGFRMNAGTATTPGSFAFAVGLRGCGNDDQIDGPVPTLGQWYHLAGTYDGSTMRFYVDGSLIGELKNIDYTPYPRFVAGCTFDQKVGGPTFFFAGEIDELRFWNHVRTEAEIGGARGKALSGNESGLVAYWNFDDGSGQTAGELVDGTYNGRLGDDADAAGDAADPAWIAIGGPATLEDLIEAVQDLDLKACHKRHLMVRLRVARKLLNDSRDSNDRAAIYLLRGFVWSVSRCTGKRMPEAAAKGLVGMALEIIEQIEDRVGPVRRASKARTPWRYFARVLRRGFGRRHT